MSLPHKATGDQVTATDYNAIIDLVNNALQTILSSDQTIDIGSHNLTIESTNGGVSAAAINISGLISIYLQDLVNQKAAYFFAEADDATFGVTDIASGKASTIGISTVNGVQTIKDYIGSLGLVDFADYSANGKQNPLWKATWGAVTSLYANGIATLVNGQVSVSNGLVKSTSRQITLGYATHSGTLGILAVLAADIVNNTSFIIKSLNSDGTVNTADNSNVRWCIISD